MLKRKKTREQRNLNVLSKQPGPKRQCAQRPPGYVHSLILPKRPPKINHTSPTARVVDACTDGKSHDFQAVGCPRRHVTGPTPVQPLLRVSTSDNRQGSALTAQAHSLARSLLLRRACCSLGTAICNLVDCDAVAARWRAVAALLVQIERGLVASIDRSPWGGDPRTFTISLFAQLGGGDPIYCVSTIAKIKLLQDGARRSSWLEKKTTMIAFTIIHMQIIP